MFYVGIDIAKNSHEVSVINSNGVLIDKSFSFLNNQDVCDKLLSFFKKFQLNSSDVIIGMEATGHYWLALYSYLINLDFTIFVINPIQSEAFRKIYIRKTKNDSKDSFVIAQIMRFGQFSHSNIASENVVSLKMLTRYRFSLIDNCSDLKRKCISLLDQVFPEYSSLFSDVFGVTSREILTRFPTPEDMQKISSLKLSSLINKTSKGRFGINKAKQIKDTAKRSFGVKFAHDCFSFQIKQIISQVNFLETQINELEEQISVLLHKFNSTITSITGIGEILGAVILAEIGDINRFSKPSELVAFAGLDASVKQSGEFTGTRNRISKRGSPHLRRALWLAADVAAFKDPALSIYYQKLIKRGKHHLVAIGAVARKLCNIIFVILRDNIIYIPKLNESNIS